MKNPKRNGEWHVHDGSAECPVHPKDLVEFKYQSHAHGPSIADEEPWAYVELYRVAKRHVSRKKRERQLADAIDRAGALALERDVARENAIKECIALSAANDLRHLDPNSHLTVAIRALLEAAK